MNAEPDIARYSREQAGPRVEISAPPVERADEVLTPLSQQLLASLHRRFNSRRLQLLAARRRRQAELGSGCPPEFVPDDTALVTVKKALGDWTIRPVPNELRDRCPAMTGAIDRKTIISALNAPAGCVIADFEDSCPPTWSNIINGQINLMDAIRGIICAYDKEAGKADRLDQRKATLIVRPRGWHLTEEHVRIGGEEVSGALFDFALYMANNYRALARSGTAPHFYLSKLESHLEARLWNDVFAATQAALGLERGTIKATVLIET